MKKTILAVMLMGLIGSASATVEKMPVVVEESGGLSELTSASQLVLASAIGLVTVYAIQQNKYTCTISKTAPKPGTNYTNEKSTCVIK